jgi:hypothetical protein
MIIEMDAPYWLDFENSISFITVEITNWFTTSIREGGCWPTPKDPPSSISTIIYPKTSF